MDEEDARCDKLTVHAGRHVPRQAGRRQTHQPKDRRPHPSCPQGTQAGLSVTRTILRQQALRPSVRPVLQPRIVRDVDKL